VQVRIIANEAGHSRLTLRVENI